MLQPEDTRGAAVAGASGRGAGGRAVCGRGGRLTGVASPGLGITGRIASIGIASIGIASIGIAGLGLAGCTTIKNTLGDVLPSGSTYESSTSLPPLEVPPGLASSSIRETYEIPAGGEPATFSQYNDPKSQQVASAPDVLPLTPEIWVERGGDKRWLVVQADPGQIWPRLREFWVANDFVIEFEDPGIGIMETAWGEKRSETSGGFFSRFRSSSGVATRDKYRIRLERGREPGTTELFLTHRGAQEREENGTVAWLPRPSDPEMEAEMLNRIMVSFGYESERASRMIAGSRPRPERAHIVTDAEGATVLALREDFERAWRRTGLALDRVGFTVQDRDRARGLFFVRYVDPLADSNRDKDKSWLGKLKFWGGDEPPPESEYLISVVGGESATQVLVLDKAGKRERSGTGDRILSLLHEQLK